MAEGIKIPIYRNETADNLTKKLADPAEKADIGSAAAACGALAASMLARAAVQIREARGEDEKLDWYVRNTEILRSYMVKLIDEDVKCRGPLRRALTEGDDRRIEAARQASVSICLEVVNMMGQCIDLALEMIALADGAVKAELAAGADLSYGASLSAGRYILYMSSLSPDDTYRYVMKRENELTMQAQKEAYERVIAAATAECE
jgi:formiminotetrahydrofolate cyclodeaminase